MDDVADITFIPWGKSKFLWEFAMRLDWNLLFRAATKEKWKKLSRVCESSVHTFQYYSCLGDLGFLITTMMKLF